jgi:hypothetical protein
MTIKLELHRIFQNRQKFDVPLFLPAIVQHTAYIVRSFKFILQVGVRESIENAPLVEKRRFKQLICDPL